MVTVAGSVPAAARASAMRRPYAAALEGRRGGAAQQLHHRDRLETPLGAVGEQVADRAEVAAVQLVVAHPAGDEVVVEDTEVVGRAHRRRGRRDRWPARPGCARPIRPVRRPASRSTTSRYGRSASVLRATLSRRRNAGCNLVAAHSTGRGGGGPVRSAPTRGTSRRYIRPWTKRTSIVSRGAPQRAKTSR